MGLLKYLQVAIVLMSSFGCFAANAQVHEFKLENGLKLFVKEDHRAPVVVFMVWYKVGSANEPGGITGVSHALEHMMFKGTPNHPKGEFSKIIAQNGGQENAFTNRDYTAYFEKLSANKLPIAFKLESDRMQNLLFDEKEFAKEIKVVKEERRMRTDDNPQSLTFERFMAAAHLSNPYHHMPIGWMNDLQNMSISDIKAWYQKWYRPNNASLVVVGDVNPQEVYALATKYFGHLKAKPLPLVKPQTAPKPMGKKELNVNIPAKLPFLVMGYNVPSLMTAKEKWQAYALEVVAGILDGGESARLPKQLVRGQQIASQADAYYDLYARFDTLFVLYGIPSSNHDSTELEKALLEQIKRLQTTKVSKQELDRIKSQVIASKVFQKDSIFGQAMQIGLLETVGLNWQTGEEYVDKINAVTAEQVQAVAQEFLVPKALTVATLNPLPIAQALD